VRGVLVKLGHLSSTCKHLGVQHSLGAEIWSSEKVDLGGYDFTTRSPWLVHQSSPNFFARNRGRKCTCLILNIFIHSGDIHRQRLKSSKIGPNFACFWPLNFFWGGPQIFGPNFQNSAYYGPRCKILWRSTDGAWRYRGEQMNFKMFKKTSAVKHKSAPKAIASGQTNYYYYNFIMTTVTTPSIITQQL